MQFSSDRSFRLWDYSVSHKQMLLRSPKSPEVAMNVDIVLWGVEYLDLATSLQGLTIVSPTREDVTRAAQAMGGEVDPSHVHCFASEGRRFFVVADGYKVLRNDLDIFESSLEYFAGTDPSRDLGDVLAHS
jgi:hypothetical protein